MASIQKPQPAAAKNVTQVPAPAKAAPALTGTKEQIAARAYELWMAAGRPNGRDKEHWLQAEREVRQGKPGASAKH